MIANKALKEKEKAKALKEKAKALKEKEKAKALKEKEKVKALKEKEKAKAKKEKEKAKALKEKEKVKALRKLIKRGGWPDLLGREEEIHEEERTGPRTHRKAPPPYVRDPRTGEIVEVRVINICEDINNIYNEWLKFNAYITENDYKEENLLTYVYLLEKYSKVKNYWHNLKRYSSVKYDTFVCKIPDEHNNATESKNTEKAEDLFDEISDMINYAYNTLLDKSDLTLGNFPKKIQEIATKANLKTT